MTPELQEALEVVERAQARALHETKAAYPLGAIVSWKHHKSPTPQEGEVVGHDDCRYRSVQVCNAKTGSTQWIDVERLL